MGGAQTPTSGPQTESDMASEEEFPILCETCLGESPFVRMQKIPYGQACKICEKPFTCYRWKPGPQARYKKTQLCQSCAKSKNVCQTCVLDLQFGLPVQVRDSAMKDHEREGMAVTQVNREYLQEVAAGAQGAEGSNGSFNKFSRPSMLLTRLQRQRRGPYYKRNLPNICSFFQKGTCNRGKACPYRHEKASTGDLAKQNIRDRYFGQNDPVAKKMLRMAGGGPQSGGSLVPPSDRSIRTLWVGGLETKTAQDDLHRRFNEFGRLASVRVIDSKRCAFVEFADRAAAEAAAAKLQSNGLMVNGLRCRVAWGKKQSSKRAGRGSGAPGGGARIPPPPGMVAPPGMRLRTGADTKDPNAAKAPVVLAGASAVSPSLATVGRPVPPPPGMGKKISYPSMDPSNLGARFSAAR